MLKQVQNPEKDGVKLTATDSEIVTTKSGWVVKNFVGDDGHEYERAEKNSIVRWFRV